MVLVRHKVLGVRIRLYLWGQCGVKYMNCVRWGGCKNSSLG